MQNISLISPIVHYLSNAMFNNIPWMSCGEMGGYQNLTKSLEKNLLIFFFIYILGNKDCVAGRGVKAQRVYQISTYFHYE